jgi:AraC-like DNA-binding protein
MIRKARSIRWSQRAWQSPTKRFQWSHARTRGLRSPGLGRAWQAIADAYFQNELHPLTRSTAANVVFEGAEIGPVRIVHLGWGAEMTVDTTHPGGYAVNIPVSGRLESVIGQNELVATPDCAVIYPPDTPSCLRHWSASLSVVGVRFADVAMRWGLVHTGRFAAAYRRKFGESPSETLRACRRC